jgi:Family of unknown function (DUF6869)
MDVASKALPEREWRVVLAEREDGVDFGEGVPDDPGQGFRMFEWRRAAPSVTPQAMLNGVWLPPDYLRKKVFRDWTPSARPTIVAPVAYWDEHPNASEKDIRALCEAWLSYQREERQGTEPDEADPHWWAVQAAMDVEFDEPLHWRIVRCLCSLAEPDDPAVAMIGIGPLETMIFQDGERAMDLIEPAADEDPVMLAALAHVWAFTDPVRPRIDRYLGSRGVERR